MRRVVLVLAVALALWPAAAYAGPLIDDPDAVALANGLAEATAEQGICYGWNVDIDDVGVFRNDAGSNLGPGVRLTSDPECERWVELRVRYRWTSSTSESEDSVDWSVESNIPDAPNTVDVRRVGFSDDDFLQNEDLAVFNATLALPTLVAEAGLAPEVRLEPNTGTIPEADRLTGSPGSDLLREWGWAFATFGLLLAGGVIWLVYELVLRRMGFRWGD